MLRLPPTRSLALVLAPLLAGCSSASTADPAPWAVSFSDQSTTDVRLAVDGATGAVALAGIVQGDLSLSEGISASSSGATQSFVGMLDPHGTPLWGSALADLPPGLTGIGFAPDGNLVVAGGVTGTMHLFSVPSAPTVLDGDVFVGKVDRSGKPLWAKMFGPDFDANATGYVTPQGFAVDGDGNAALGGVFYGGIDFGGALLTTQAQACFVAKLDRDGGHVFDLSFGSYGTSVPALAFDRDGALLVGGVNGGTLTIGGADFTSGGEGGYVAKLDRSGAAQWAFQLGGVSEVLALAADPSGNVLVGGRFQQTLQAGPLTVSAPSTAYSWSGFVLQVDRSGTPAWMVALPQVEVHSIAAAPGGGAVASGYYYGSPDLGLGPLPTPQGTAMFAARVDEDGKLTSATGFSTQPSDTSPYAYAGAYATTIGATPSGAVLGGYFGSALHIGGTTLQASGPSDLFVARVAF